MIIKKNRKRPVKMIAHRGYSGIEQENTMAAFIAASNRSYYGIELDVHLTNDGVFVICHDGDVKRVSPFDYEIKNTSYNKLAEITLYDKVDKEVKSHLRIPTLKDYLLLATKYKKHSFIEIKPEFNDEEIKRLFYEISKYSNLANISIISFKYSNLEKMRNFSKTISLQYLANRSNFEVLEQCKRINADLDVHYKHIEKCDIDLYHNQGLKVNVWTIDSIEIAEKFSRWGVDFITTNILE